MPANPSFTNSTTVVTVTVAKILNTNAIVPRNRIRSSASHVPGKRNPKQNPDGRNRDDEDESSAEARSRDQAVQFTMITPT